MQNLNDNRRSLNLAILYYTFVYLILLFLFVAALNLQFIIKTALYKEAFVGNVHVTRNEDVIYKDSPLTKISNKLKEKAESIESKDVEPQKLEDGSSANTQQDDKEDKASTSKNEVSSITMPNPVIKETANDSNTKKETEPDKKATELEKENANKKTEKEKIGSESCVDSLTFLDATYSVAMGRGGENCLIANKKSLPSTLRPYCYPYDMDGIWHDIKSYAKSKGFVTFGRVSSSMTDEIAEAECSWDYPDVLSYSGDSAIIKWQNQSGLFHTRRNEIDEILSLRYNILSSVDYLASIGKTDLACWFREFSSPYNTVYGDRALWSGSTPKRYQIYFFFGWSDIPQIIEE